MDVLWHCEADIPSDLSFSQTEVICEGYISADDERVLEGSCGLEYSLTHTGWKAGRSREQDAFDSSQHGHNQRWEFKQLMAFAIFLYIAYSFYRICARRGIQQM